MKYQFHHLLYRFFFRLHCWAGARAADQFSRMEKEVIAELNAHRRLREL